MADTKITSVLDHLHLALRYVASGFVAVGVYFFLFRDGFEEFATVIWILFFIAAAVGVVTYGLHFATMDKIFHGMSVIQFIKKNKFYLPPIISENIEGWEKGKAATASNFTRTLMNDAFMETIVDEAKANPKTVVPGSNKARNIFKRKILFAMANQTYLRQISLDTRIRELQAHLEKRLALLNFMYCTCYQITIGIIFYTCYWKFVSGPEKYFVFGVLSLAAVGALIFICARRFNNRIISREMWLAVYCRQDNPDFAFDKVSKNANGKKEVVREGESES